MGWLLKQADFDSLAKTVSPRFENADEKQSNRNRR